MCFSKLIFNLKNQFYRKNKNLEFVLRACPKAVQCGNYYGNLTRLELLESS
ncbi:hypothetical protein LEP1GSC151_3845 [Leptospira interrogans serovar Grippotyphosa str. LT2186]|uniref:Uncharacterized protein n=1 Tax=Leptospira interrogans serovar Grippotyphosa str. LT2186 TaxID=1001599 RepID=M3I117_LEPIR|nr:hypothetical protein LEP1GSC151_3845 [Leptospira interrogans serovar Grippotyphosa str. LT2186]